MRDGITSIIAPQQGGQTRFLSKADFEVLYGGAAGPGKMLSLETEILVPGGYVKMKDIETGETIITDKGTEAIVLGKSKIERDPDAYEIEFGCGEIVKCDARHLWRVFSRKEGITKLTNTLSLTSDVEYQKKPNYLIPKQGGGVHYIVSIKKTPPEPMQCITVSDPDGMYCVTRRNIPTHNSWALVIDALGLQYEKTELGKRAIDCPKYRAVLFRRRSTQLAELIDEAKEYYQHFGGEYISGRKGDPGPSVNFPSGAKIYFCHLNEEKDKESHHGFEYQFVGFDELTQFTFTQYIYLFSRCRSTIAGLFPRIRSTTNPIGEGLRWVRLRFEPNFRENVTQYFISDPENEDNYRGIEVSPKHKDALPRCYVPGRLAENKILMEKDPKYASRIKAMGKRTAAALLNSDWEAMEGQFFDVFSSRIHVIKPENYLSWTDIKNAYKLEGGLDYGNDTILLVAGKDTSGNVVFVDEIYFNKTNRTEKIEGTKEFLAKRGLAKMLVVGDTNMWIKDAFDKADQLSPAMEYLKAGIRLTKVSKTRTTDKAYRKNTNDAFKNYLYWEENDEGEVTKQPRIKIYARCKNLISCLSDLVADPDDPEDIKDGQFDHPYDGGKYVFMHLTAKKEETQSDEPAWLRRLKRENAQTKKPKSFMGV